MSFLGVLATLAVLLLGAIPGCPTQALEAQRPAPEPLPVRAGAAVESLLAAAPEGAFVRVPRARYLVARPIVIRRSVHLEGEPGTVLELRPGTSMSLLEIRGATVDSCASAIEVENLSLIGNRNAQNAGSGITMLSARRCALRNLSIASFHTDGVYGSNVQDCVFEGLTLSDCGRNGLAFGEAVLERSSAGNRVIRCVARSNGLIGFDVEPGIANSFQDCEAQENGRYGFSFGAGRRSHENVVERCSATGNGDSGINIWSDADTVRACTSRSNGEDGIAVIGPDAVGNVVIDCAAERNGRHGIGLDRTSATLLSRNSCRDNGNSKPGDGIALVTSVPIYDNIFSHNVVSGASHRYALVITEGARQTILDGNRFDGLLSIAARDVTWR